MKSVAVALGLGTLVGIAAGVGFSRLTSGVPRAGWGGSAGNRVRLEDRSVLSKGSHRSAPRLPAPRGTRASVPSDTVDVVPREFLSIRQLMNADRTAPLSAPQLAKYLRENKRSAGSLLAAARMTGDPAFLQEARRAFPEDPRVLLDAILLDPTMSAAERRQAIEALRTASPDNALGNYLSAHDHFAHGNADEAVRDMWNSLNQSELKSYRMETWLDLEEAYLSAGYSPASAAANAMFSMQLPELSPLVELSRYIRGVRNQYLQAGDAPSAQAMAEVGLLFGQQVQADMGYWVIDELVGMKIEKQFLDMQDAQAVLEPGCQTIADRLAELDQRQRFIHAIEPQVVLLDSLPEPEILQFFERTKLYGEVEAWHWLLNKYGTNGVPVPAEN